MPASDRYQHMTYRRCGRSGLKLPAISLGCWHNFGAAGTASNRLEAESEFHDNCRAMLVTAFDHGITHFDLANNYGPPAGSAEERVGRILRQDFSAHRDELVISSKAGYYMWPGPYGEWGSRKNLLASLDQSLQRLGLDYVDIFYSHRPDPETPLAETLGALDHAVRSGKALYCGISSYDATLTRRVTEVCAAEGLTRPIIHQPSYNMLNRWIEPELVDAADELGLGIIAFCPLAQGQLTSKYLGSGVPDDSRAAINAMKIDEQLRVGLRRLHAIAEGRGQSLAQLALTWALRLPPVTSALIGASRPEQITENVQAATAEPLSAEELHEIDAVLTALK